MTLADVICIFSARTQQIRFSFITQLDIRFTVTDVLQMTREDDDRAPLWWGNHGYQFGVEDDAGLSGELQNMLIFTQVCWNQDERSRTTELCHDYKLICGQLFQLLRHIVNVQFWCQWVCRCVVLHPPRKKGRFKAVVALSQRIDTACKSHLRWCSQTFGRKPHFWLHIPAWFYSSSVFCWEE